MGFIYLGCESREALKLEIICKGKSGEKNQMLWKRYAHDIKCTISYICCGLACKMTSSISVMLINHLKY